MSEKENWVEINLADEAEADKAARAAATPKELPEPDVDEEHGQNQEQTPEELAGIETEGAAKRIKKLVRQRKDTEQALAQERQARLALEARLAKLEKVATESARQDAKTHKTTIESNLTLLEGQYAAAIEAGDAKGAAKLMKELVVAQSRLDGLDTRIDELEPDEREDAGRTQQQQRQTQQQQAPRLHAKTQAFIDKHEKWWGKDVVATAAATAIAKSLESEGFSPDEDDYYEEVEARLKKEFPTKFGAQQREGRTGRQTLGGSSGTPPAKGNVVRLSQDEVTMAKRLGITPAQYAAEKRRMEQSESNGYTEIV